MHTKVNKISTCVALPFVWLTIFIQIMIVCYSPMSRKQQLKLQQFFYLFSFKLRKWMSRFLRAPEHEGQRLDVRWCKRKLEIQLLVSVVYLYGKTKHETTLCNDWFLFVFLMKNGKHQVGAADKNIFLKNDIGHVHSISRVYCHAIVGNGQQEVKNGSSSHTPFTCEIMDIKDDERQWFSDPVL